MALLSSFCGSDDLSMSSIILCKCTLSSIKWISSAEPVHIIQLLKVAIFDQLADLTNCNTSVTRYKISTHTVSEESRRLKFHRRLLPTPL